ncbi:CIC11C00000004886 [Sungouiella intermedia]|uniref:guanosine-diphosphatase n=1 Tax=Sungouiella intermedia TaxID=45354 RepID=A0A1L0CTN3_9ASCO|nr:CIC11C00000004886 [[Candida] intermedia]
MLNTRNIRVVVAAFVLFTVVGYFAFSSSSFTESVNRVKPPASPDFVLEEGNTLQGSSHQGSEAPYKASNNLADKLGSSKPGLDDDKETTDSKADSKAGYDADVDSKVGSKVNPEDSPDADSKVDSKVGSTAKTGSKGSESESDSTQPLKEVKTAGEKCEKTDYVVMIDAGSSGSRVHVYSFDTCVSPPLLLNEEFKMLNPGLSSFDADTVGAAKSLDPLLEVALKTVPKDKQGCTPVAVKATAGLRLLGKEKSDAILAEVRKHLETNYPFAVVKGDGVSIMEGKDEGVYAWITTNYLLGNIGVEEKLPTAAVFDLGGGSTQIVFEPEFPDNEVMAEGEHKYEFTFGSRKFTLYQFSHLGYGLMEGRNKVNSLVVNNHIKNKKAELTKYTTKAEAKDAKATVTIVNPCFPPDVEAENVQVKISDDEIYVVNFKGPSDVTGPQCRHLAEQVLNKKAECKTLPCSFNGAYQPSLVRAFHRDSDMWVFSFFYDRTNPLGFPGSFKMDELMDLTKTVCSGLNLWEDVLLGDGASQLKKEPSWCLDLSFISAMLHTGYNIPLSRELKTAKTIADNELGWCLGASLPLLDAKAGNWQCRVDQVE